MVAMRPDQRPRRQQPPQPVPTLGEWGLIIFCVVLFGYMAVSFVRRRRIMQSNM